MITNNKYIRGNIGEFDKQVSSNIKIEDYEGNKANKYLVTKEYLNQQKIINPNNIFYFNNNLINYDLDIIIFELYNELLIDSYIIYQEKKNNNNIITVKNYLVKLYLEHYDEEEEIYIYKCDKEKKELLKSNTIYICSDYKRYYCIDNEYIIPLIEINDIINDNIISKIINNSNIEIKYQYIFDYINFLKNKKIKIDLMYFLNLQNNINSNNIYKLDINFKYISLLFLKFIYTYNNNYLKQIPINIYNSLINAERMDYELKLKDEYTLLNTLNSFSKYDYKKYYNINSTSGIYILFISTENKTINSIDDFENLHFTIYGENLNNISRYIDISDTKYTFILKKKTLNDNIFYSYNGQLATVLPTLNTTSFGQNTFEYYDNAYNVNYRYVLMDEIENNSGLCASESNVYVKNNIIILYHVYSKTFFIGSICHYKFDSQPNFYFPSSFCFMPVKQYTNYNAYNDLLNTFFYKRLTLLNKNIFSNNNEYYNDINNLDYDIYKDCKNQINLYINSQTYSTNNIILSNWENVEKYENINLQLDIYSNIHPNYN